MEDQHLLETVLGMPASTLCHRRAQEAQLLRRFGNLARIPLDRVNGVTEPLNPGPFYPLLTYLTKPWRRLRNKFKKHAQNDQMRYVRLYDFNNTAWKSVRRQAQSHRHCIEHLLNPDPLAKILPPPDVDLDQPNVFTTSSGAKLILGFILWAKDHPEMIA